MEDGTLEKGGIGERRMEDPVVKTEGWGGRDEEERDGQEERNETGEHGWEVRANQIAGRSRSDRRAGGWGHGV